MPTAHLMYIHSIYDIYSIGIYINIMYIPISRRNSYYNNSNNNNQGEFIRV